MSSLFGLKCAAFLPYFDVIKKPKILAILLSTICFLGGLNYGFGIAIVGSFAEPFSTLYLGPFSSAPAVVQNLILGLVPSAFMLGCLLGSFPISTLTRLTGNKWTLIVGWTVSLLGVIVSYCSVIPHLLLDMSIFGMMNKNAFYQILFSLVFLLGRVITGGGVNMVMVVASGYGGEVAGTYCVKYIGIVNTMTSVGIQAGIFLTWILDIALVNTLKLTIGAPTAASPLKTFIYENVNLNGALIGNVLMLIPQLFLFSCIIPESPMWLASKRRGVKNEQKKEKKEKEMKEINSKQQSKEEEDTEKEPKKEEQITKQSENAGENNLTADASSSTSSRKDSKVFWVSPTTAVLQTVEITPEGKEQKTLQKINVVNDELQAPENRRKSEQNESIIEENENEKSIEENINAINENISKTIEKMDGLVQEDHAIEAGAELPSKDSPVPQPEGIKRSFVPEIIVTTRNTEPQSNEAQLPNSDKEVKRRIDFIGERPDSTQNSATTTRRLSSFLSVPDNLNLLTEKENNDNNYDSETSSTRNMNKSIELQRIGSLEQMSDLDDDNDEREQFIKNKASEDTFSNEFKERERKNLILFQQFQREQLEKEIKGISDQLSKLEAKHSQLRPFKEIEHYIESKIQEETEQQTTKILSQQQNEEKPAKLQFWKIRKFHIHLLMAFYFPLMMQLTGISAIVFFFKEFLINAGFTSSILQDIARVLLGVYNIVVAILPAFLMPSLGARKVLLLGCALVTMGLTMITISLIFTNLQPLIGYFSLAGIFVYYTGMILGPATIFYVFLYSDFPSKKTTGKVTITSFNIQYVISILVAWLYMPIETVIGSATIFCFFVIVSIFGYLLYGFFYPDPFAKKKENIEIQKKEETKKAVVNIPETMREEEPAKKTKKEKKSGKKEKIKNLNEI